MCDEERKQKPKMPIGMELVNTFDDSTGIVDTFKASYYQQDMPNIDGKPLAMMDIFHNLPEMKSNKGDPVYVYNKDARADFAKTAKATKEAIKELPKLKLPATTIEPSVSTRLAFNLPYMGLPGAKYIAPDMKGTRKIRQENRRKEKLSRADACEYEVVRVPSPTILDSIAEKIELITPPVSNAKVVPEKPSFVSPDAEYPHAPTPSMLDLKHAKSGIIINIPKKKGDADDDDEMEGAPEKRGRKKARIRPDEEVKTQIGDMMDYLFTEMDGEDGYMPYPFKAHQEDRSTHISDEVVLGKVGEIISKASSATSIQDKAAYDDVSWCDIPAISKLVQTLRDAQFEKPKKRYKKGALENHSFTKLRQSTLEDFCYQCINGSIHQGDICFPKASRNRQGICMPTAAFCYAHMQNPKDWVQRNIDEILELGNCLYMRSIGELHMHKNRAEVAPEELQKFMIIGDKKIKFEISDPEVKGLVRSSDKKIYNLSSGLRMFFLRSCACLLRTEDVNVIIWKPKKKCYYFFDACARKNSLYQDPNGTAIFAYVKRLKAIITILLDRTSLGNSPFNLCQIKVLKVMGKDEEEIPPYISEHHTFRMLNDRQAVVQASFDMGDLCFNFTRNKQALTMSTVALIYARITAPNTWHKKTLDKIMIIGNQLHKLCAEPEGCTEITIEHLPAVCTVGPYIIEMHLYPNRYADLMFKKGNCIFEENLQLFFEKNTNCIAQIGKSYLGIWMQRDMYFCFDPYTRNKEGLKCRTGAACVTMNKNVETLVETVLLNFENREAIFYLHALKIMRIQRDPDLDRAFPKNIPLHDICAETFRKHKTRKSKKKAVAHPITVDFSQKALKRLLMHEEMDPSLTEVGSNVASILTNILPALEPAKLEKLPPARQRDPENDKLVDLDSASLSDTQIEPKKPCPFTFDEEDIPIDDLDSYELTQEEKELEDNPEGEGGEGGVTVLRVKIGGEGEEGAAVTESSVSKFGMASSQVNSDELLPCFNTKMMNTDLTYCYEILPAVELPMKNKDDREIVIDEDAQEEEFFKKRNYVDVRDGMQILVSRTHGLAVCGDCCPNVLIPYMCIMASAYALEVPLHKWEPRTLDFILKAGVQLYNQYREPFLKIDDFKFELEHTSLFATVDLIFNTYIGRGLFETFGGQKVLEDFIETHVFTREDCGLVVVPHYTCAVFYKRNLFYLFEPHNCDDYGIIITKEDDESGKACLMRFKDLNALITHLVTNLSLRAEQKDDSNLEFRMMTLAKPVFGIRGNRELPSFEGPPYSQDELERTQSREIKRPSNFVDMPDGSQLIRAHCKVHDFGVEVEHIAPYICIMASAVSGKYAVRTWSGQVVDFIMRAGNELYKKTNYKFEQLAHLEIPRVVLGHTEFSIETQYFVDKPIKLVNLMIAIERVVAEETDWALIITEVYSCAVFQRNGLLYLFDPFPCNELGLEDGNTGAACVSRFKTFHDVSIRIIFNQNARDNREKVDHVNFILSAVRAIRISPEYRIERLTKKLKCDLEGEHKRLAVQGKGQGEGESDIGEEEVEEEEEGEKEEPEKINKIGYLKKAKYKVIEGSRALAKPGSGDVDLSDDHFVCLVACLMVINKPLNKWDTRTMDRVFDIGHNVYVHADNLEISKKRTIKNILIGKHFFDVIVKMLTIDDYRKKKSFDIALKYIMRKRKFCIVAFGEGTYIIYLDAEHNAIHLFNPYQCTLKGKNDEEQDVGACWILFSSVKRMKKFLKLSNNLNRFSFYTFSVINVTKAPKSIIISYQIQEYIRQKQQKGEIYGKSFNEHSSWMDLQQNPWAKMSDDSNAICVRDRGKWFNWNIEYCNDLFSLMGTIHQNDRPLFKSKSRGKQTLTNAVMAIGMTGIYDLREWNTSVVDAILINGDKYFLKTIENISDQNHEMVMEDLLLEGKIYPYKFKIRYQPVIEGTMFLNHQKKFNLYKALRYFFGDFYYRAGIIVACRGSKHPKRILAFAKRRDNEYYMFDSQSFGPPMFSERQGVAYVLRCTTLARLVHILVLTLRGGDFFIYEVVAECFEPIPDEEKDEDDEKKDD